MTRSRIALIVVTIGLALCGVTGAVAAQEISRKGEADDIAALTQPANALEKAGNYGEALGLRRKLAGLIETSETAAAGKPGAKTADALGTLAWTALFAHEFKDAIAASERGYPFAPDLLWIETNHAHAHVLGADRRGKSHLSRQQGKADQSG